MWHPIGSPEAEFFPRDESRTREAMGPPERREHARIPYFTEALLEGLDVTRVACRLSDLSVGGAFVDARTTLPTGARVRMQFRLADREIAVVAEVRYAAPGIGMGVRFVNLSEPDLALINSAVTTATAPPGQAS